MGDDCAINALESMKAQAAHIAKQVDETQEQWRSWSRQPGGRFRLPRPDRACSSRSRVSRVCFLYQFSLNVFLSLLAKVLELPHQTDCDSSQAVRIAQTHRTQFAQVAMRDSCGLEENDKLKFALR
jgi:hypothetical protein